MSDLNNHYQDLYNQYGYSKEYIDASRAKYRVIFRFYGLGIFLFLIGSYFVIPFVFSQETACYISKIEWFRNIWANNQQYTQILEFHSSHTKINACHLITSTSWSALISFALLIVRAVIELIHIKDIRLADDIPFKTYQIIGLIIIAFVSASSIGIWPLDSFLNIKEQTIQSKFSITVFSSSSHVHFIINISIFFSSIIFIELLILIFQVFYYRVKKIYNQLKESKRFE